MQKLKILEINRVTHDVKRFKLQKPQGYKFTPGQATEIAVNMKGWEGKKRPFTFTSLNSDDYLEFLIKGYPLDKYPQHGGVTEQIHKLNAGDELLVGNPWGAIEYKSPGVFIAAGAGITPFIAIFREVAKSQQLRDSSLIFSNKTKGDVIMEQLLRDWFSDNLVLTLTREDRQEYERGRIDENFIRKHVDDFRQHFYICGPRKMVKDVTNIVTSLGASTDTVIFEK